MPKISLPKYLKWLERRNLSQKTIYVYSWALRKYGLKEFDTDSIAIFFKEELNRYQPNGLNSLLNGLVSYAKFAKIEIEWELITRLIPTVQQKFFPTVNENELNRLKLVRTKTKPTINQRNNVIFDFLFNTGIRIGELVNIRHCDYQDGNLLIHGKGNKDRYIPIPPFLEKYFNGSSDFMFKHERVKWTKKAVRSMIFRKVEKAGFNKNITPHTFRRSLPLFPTIEE